MPCGFSVEGFDPTLVAHHHFGVVAVGEFYVEGVGAGLGAVLGCDCAFQRDGLDLRERACAARGFHVLIQDLGGILRVQRSGDAEEDEGDSQEQFMWAGAHGAQVKIRRRGQKVPQLFQIAARWNWSRLITKAVASDEWPVARKIESFVWFLGRNAGPGNFGALWGWLDFGAWFR